MWYHNHLSDLHNIDRDITDIKWFLRVLAVLMYLIVCAVGGVLAYAIFIH